MGQHVRVDDRPVVTLSSGAGKVRRKPDSGTHDAQTEHVILHYETIKHSV